MTGTIGLERGLEIVPAPGHRPGEPSATLLR